MKTQHSYPMIKMKNNTINMVRMARRLTLGCLLLLFMAGNALAQSDPQYVIKYTDTQNNVHYLSRSYNAESHVWSVQDSETFNPSCLWYSSNNYNYYFLDGTSKKYLTAPLACNGSISLDNDPGIQELGNTEKKYYFYDWDHGLARGKEHEELQGNCPTAYNSSGQCWEVVWVSYENNQWQMSSTYGYNPTAHAARFYRVTVTEHAQTITASTGGLEDLTGFDMTFSDDPQNIASQGVSASVTPYTYTYIPAYTTYVFDGGTHNYYNSTDNGNSIPTSVTSDGDDGEGNTVTSYAWELTSDEDFLSFSSTSSVTSVEGEDESSQTVYYINENTGYSHQTVTLTLTVTYSDNSTQTSTASILAKISCKNPDPDVAPNPVITFEDVTIYWPHTADKYLVEWKKASEEGDPQNSKIVEDGSSCRITGLEYDTEYKYRITAYCNDVLLETAGPYRNFTTLKEPSALVYGSVYGGGRMANVGGNTTVVVVNCEELGAIYGGNDIAGAVQGTNGSTIVLGVDESAPYTIEHGEGVEDDEEVYTTAEIKIGDVYGGGNGYYAYNGSSFEAASSNYTSQTVAPSASVKAMTQSNQVGDVVWTNDSEDDYTLDFPSIVKTNITVANDYVKVDSIFGGAKNAFLTHIIGYEETDEHDPIYAENGSEIEINGGTVFAVFGGNNIGGKQGYGKHRIEVNNTKTELSCNLTSNTTNTPTTGYGRDFGIRYLFGGGNKVYGSTTEIFINGGQCDTIFAGGNAADVYAANVTVNCPIAAHTDEDYTFGSVYSDAISNYADGNITINDSYAWNGTGIYNVVALFGGNNKETMSKVPSINLTSGSVCTVYGGGNAGDMLAQETDDCTNAHEDLEINDDEVKYGTHVQLNNANMLVDYLYGGCQMSNVHYSTWVEIKNGHVGTVYGGCNVSGDVGSNRLDTDQPEKLGEGDDEYQNPEYQKVYGGTYVVATGGTVHKNLYAGGNGFYHCSTPTGQYDDAIDFNPPYKYYNLYLPTHNETHVIVDGVTVKGNVYAGGNMACVGFDNGTVAQNPSYPRFVGWTSVRMKSGIVEGNVYGGGNRANVYGSNEVQVSGGYIGYTSASVANVTSGANGASLVPNPKGGALYGGNDRTGKVAEFSNRVLDNLNYGTASDEETSLLNPKVQTYISLTGNPNIATVYGGGNGDYAYFNTLEEAAGYMGTKETVVGCGSPQNQPIQGRIFVDIGIDGENGNNGSGYIGTVYGGGNGVSVTHFIKVFLNVQNVGDNDGNHVGTIFGGNNIGDLELVPDIVLLSGNVGDVYGGCNQGAMTATETEDGNNTKTIELDENHTYNNIGSYVRLSNTYQATSESDPVDVNVKVNGSIYGGCRMNDVTNNTLVLIEGGDHGDVDLFGGCDVSGTVNGISQVVITDGEVDNIYTGGNGNYNYETGVYANLSAPGCANTKVELLGGTVNNNVFGGGYGAGTTVTNDVTVIVGDLDAESGPTIQHNVYGGSALGTVNSDGNDQTTINILNGTVNGDVFGGGLGNDDNAATVYGEITVNIGALNNETGATSHYGKATINGNIFGCNDLNGSPQDDVTVNIYGTAHTTNNTCPDPQGMTPEDLEELFDTEDLADLFALKAVYGGGNWARYDAAGKTTTVNILGCENSVMDVYGGGNAADVGVEEDTTTPETDLVITNTEVSVQGGLIYRVFGGGNGYSETGNHDNPNQPNYNPGANITGTSTTGVHGGLFSQIFGGSNQYGNVPDIVLNIDNTGGCGEVILESFCGSNQSDLTANVDAHIDMDCIQNTIGNLYGGSNQADIHGNVSLTVYGGTYTNVFGGSKGTPEKEANIYGDVTLTIKGGRILNAYGGSDYRGKITGTITVNVEDAGGAGYCSLDLTNVYGGGRDAEYKPGDEELEGKTAYENYTSPVVNIKHGTVKGNVYGGGYGTPAIVWSNPQVNIGNIANTTHKATVKGNVYGGGNEANVKGNIAVNVQKGNTAVEGNVYGGGCLAIAEKNTTVTLTDGEIGVMGEWDEQTYNNGVPVRPVTGGNVFGGGQGSTTDAEHGRVKGNTEVIISNGIQIHNCVFGGGELGSVGTVTNNVPVANTGLAKVTINGGEIGPLDGTGTNAYVYGGGQGKGDDTNNDYKEFANVNNSEVYINTGARIYGSIFGGASDGHVLGNANVYFTGGIIGTNGTTSWDGNIFGGGRNFSAIHHTPGRVEGNINITMTDGTLKGSIFGGGRLGMTGVDVNGNMKSDIADDPETEGNEAQTIGKVTINVSGGTIGNPAEKRTCDFSIGDVFGAGKGKDNDTKFGRVKNTEINISQAEGKTTRIYGSVYGGGEMATVGWIDNNDTYINNSADTTGFAMVTITGGTIGMDNMKMSGTGITKPDDFGHVFGGGKGIVGDTVVNPTITQLANVRVAWVNIKDDAFVLGSVYGGAENGHVYDSTYVLIEGGQIGCAEGMTTPYTDTDFNPETIDPEDYPDGYWLTECAHDINHGSNTFYGNVFGGGSGLYPYYEESDINHENPINIWTAGQVKGNTLVEVTGGHILTNVYGGNELTDVLGNTHIHITGGTVGVPRTLDQINANPKTCYVYGGGKGGAGTQFNTWTNVKNSFVVIDQAENKTTCVYGSVFGGGEDGHILSDAHTTIKNGIIGTFGYSGVDGNIFGGGRGFNAVAKTAGGVGGNTVINIEDGSILGSVFGGGRLGSVGIYFTAPEHENYGKIKPDDDNGTYGYTTVNVSGGTIGHADRDDNDRIGGNVYGGGMGVAAAPGSLYTQMALAKQSTVTISEADGKQTWIRGSVFGGGDDGHMNGDKDNIAKGDTYVYIQGGQIGGLKDNNGNAILSHDSYHGNVYGGGRGLDTYGDQHLHSSTAGKVNGNTNVSVTGGRVCRNVYGGGSMASVGNGDEQPVNGTYQTGMATVSITGGIIGFDGGINYQDDGNGNVYENIENGFVFGGGRGLPGTAYRVFDFVKNTNVTIGGTAYITGSVFAGAEDGHVRHDAKVTINQEAQPDYFIHNPNNLDDPQNSIEPYPIIGTPLTAAEMAEDIEDPIVIYRGNVYGGGRGIDTDNNHHLSPTAGVVYGNSEVEINGGTIRHDVYGGGSIASVGTLEYDENGEVTGIDDETGLSKVTINGGIIGMSPLLTVTQIADDMTTTDVNEAHNLSGVNNGQVFGGGRGASGATFKNLAFVRETLVQINQTNNNIPTLVCGAVFGGGCNGHVKENTLVTMTGGEIGHELAAIEKEVDFLHPTPIYHGNVYGGGRGIDHADTPQHLSHTAGLVYGNTEVRISGGLVHDDVYGGGSLANVGTFTEDEQGNITYNTGGQAKVTITGTAQIGDGGGNNGYVYGSGRGAAGDTWADMAYVKNTIVTIGTLPESGESKDDPATEQYPLIKASVFGGGSNGHVRENTDVYINSGTIGTPLTLEEMVESNPSTGNSPQVIYRGNVYGGGRGVDRVVRDNNELLSPTAGKVFGNTNVTFNGGKVYHNIYGGGSLANVGVENDDNTGIATVTINGGEVGMKHGVDYVNPEGNTTIYSGLNNGQVYGSGRGEAGEDFVDHAFVKYTHVNVNGGEIFGAVFGGGANGHVRKDTHVNIKGGTIGIDDVTENSVSIYRGNVYGGGRGIDTGTDHKVSPTAGLVMGNTNITVEGGTIYRNIYGGGSLATVGEFTTNAETGAVTGHTAGGETHITIKGGTIGIDGNNNGRIFGAGRGMAGYATIGTGANAYTIDFSHLTYVYDTYINVETGANIKGSVFGSGDNGHTWNDTHVTMNGGIIGTNGGAVDGNIFGGGRGQDTYGNNSMSVTAGKVFGNTYVTMTGGTIKANLYGGGNMSSVEGTANVTVEGSATVGINANDETLGNVFGACRGDASKPEFAHVGNTNVNINDNSAVIMNNVYGGGEKGIVDRKTEVTINGATVNNVFGAGMGIENIENELPFSSADVYDGTTVTLTNGMVKGSIYGGGQFGSVGLGLPENTSKETHDATSTINIDGGRVKGSVYGGGNMGFTQGNTYVNVSGNSIIDESVFGGAFGALNTVYLAGQRVVNMRGGTVYGNVYGGSRNADDALVFNPSDFASNTEDGTVSVVNISGGHATRHVFGATLFGKTFGSTYVFVGTNAIMNAPHHTAASSETDPYNEAFYRVHKALIIDRDVWAGADFGNNVGSTFGASTVTGNSDIYIDGRGYDTESVSNTSNNFMILRGSVFGCGTSCDAGRQDRYIVIRNYGNAVANTNIQRAIVEPYIDATRTLYSIQRADRLVIDASHIHLSGLGMVSSSTTTEKYAIHEFEAVKVVNGSSLFTDEPVENIKALGSYTCENVYAATPTYVEVSYNQLGLQGGDHDNKVRINNGSYISVQYTTASNNTTQVQYGELKGFFHWMSDRENSALIFARPKHNQDHPSATLGENDYPNDGGFVSYRDEYNEWDINGVEASNGVQIPYENHVEISKDGLSKYYRVWRYSASDHSTRDGVLNAKTVSGGNAFLTTNVSIELPPFRNGGKYYRIANTAGVANIDYGTEVLMVNATKNGMNAGNNWLYYNGQDFAIENTSDPATSSAIGSVIATMTEFPNNVFGLLAQPQGSLTGNSMVVCTDANDGLIDYEHNRWSNNLSSVEKPMVNFVLTYSNSINGNFSWDPITLTFEQVDESGSIKEIVDVTLTINTITTIEQDIHTVTYALMVNNNGSQEATFSANALLPTYQLNNQNGHSTWTLTAVEWIPETGFDQNTLVVNNEYLEGNPTMDYISMKMFPTRNVDNTNGWVNDPANITPIEIGQYKGQDHLQLPLGESDGRTPITFNFTLRYDGHQKIDPRYNATMGTAKLTVHFTNYENGTGADNGFDLHFYVSVVRRGEGDKFYLDGVAGNTRYGGKNPNAAKPSLGAILYFTDFKPGDEIYVVNTVTVKDTDGQVWNGHDYGQFNIYRYPGGHVCYTPTPGQLDPNYNPNYDVNVNKAFRGPLISVEKSLTISDTQLDGAYLMEQMEGNGSNPQHVDDHVIARAPLIEVKNGGSLILVGGPKDDQNTQSHQTYLHNNYNNHGDGGAVYVEEGGMLTMSNLAHIEDNFVVVDNGYESHGGGVYLAAGGTLLLSDKVSINDNYRVVDTKLVKDNVYLPTAASVVTIGTQDAFDDYVALDNDAASVGITKTNWGTNADFTPVAYAEEGMEHLANLLGAAILFDDEGIFTPEKYEPDDPEYKLYFVKTWVNFVTNEPTNFDHDQINSAEDLAWAISLVNGLNGQTADPDLDFTITSNIDMSEHIWVPIGTTANPYAGNFNGQGRLINGLHSPLSPEDLGVFGVVGDNAVVNEMVVTTDFSGGTVKHLGGLVGSMAGGTVSNSRVNGSLVGKEKTLTIGGIVGDMTGGEIINSIAVPAITTTGNTCVTGGLVGKVGEGSSVKNSFAHFTLSQTGRHYSGGLVGHNEGVVDNAYALLREDSSLGEGNNFGYLVGNNQGTLTHAYAATTASTPLVKSGYEGTACNTFTPVVRPYGYGLNGMGNKVGEDNLVDLLNGQVTAVNGYSKWLRTSASPLNGDYPILRYDNLEYTTVASSDNLFLDYGKNFTKIIEKYNGITGSSTILVYENSEVHTLNEDHVTIYVDEDVSLLQDCAGNLQNVYVGLTMDNSDGGDLGGKPYDWHMFASPLTNAPVGITYGSSTYEYLQEPDFHWNIEVDGYFPTKKDFPDEENAQYITPLTSFDLYTYFEPQYHWINLKRNSSSHWHEDGEHDLIDYYGDWTWNDNVPTPISGNETRLVPGKGYLAAIDEQTYLQAQGTLNNGTVTIPVTNSDLTGTTESLKGFNLLGNPYQSYLDFDAFATTNSSLWSGANTTASYTILDADANGYLNYTPNASRGAEVASRYLHPHQGFFIVTNSNSTATFTNTMRTYTKDEGSYFRGDERPAYPLINLKSTDAEGRNEFLVVEAGRPSLDGAEKMLSQRHSNALFFAKFDGTNYSILFTPEEAHEVPVYFDVLSSGQFTISWNTQNEGFTYVHLIDHLTGANIDCLKENQYSFYADKSDYNARFKLVFYVSSPSSTDTDENFAFFIDNGWFVHSDGVSTLQVVDLLGRILGTETVCGDKIVYCVPDVPGVYMLRLINGDNVKTQKIVVKQ